MSTSLIRRLAVGVAAFAAVTLMGAVPAQAENPLCNTYQFSIKPVCQHSH